MSKKKKNIAICIFDIIFGIAFRYEKTIGQADKVVSDVTGLL